MFFQCPVKHRANLCRARQPLHGVTLWSVSSPPHGQKQPLWSWYLLSDSSEVTLVRAPCMWAACLLALRTLSAARLVFVKQGWLTPLLCFSHSPPPHWFTWINNADWGLGPHRSNSTLDLISRKTLERNSANRDDWNDTDRGERCVRVN